MTKPLAERIRPKDIKSFIGQEHLIGVDGILHKYLLQNEVLSFILWGTPGTGKTTLAYLVARSLEREFYTLSAISSGLKDIRMVIEKAKINAHLKAPVLFIDEIHRFNKVQQDALLGVVERQEIILIGATTENPSFEIISALLSRMHVLLMKPHTKLELNKILNRAIETDKELSKKNITLKETNVLINLSGGDARKMLNILEMLINYLDSNDIIIDDQTVEKISTKNTFLFDKKGEQHYNLISAFIKSIRGSDPNAAVYWLARLLLGGEDIKFIGRRMMILATEDIGNANPNALLLATNTFTAVQSVGLPEARIILSQCALYLATSPKSNASYLAIEEAIKLTKRTGDLPVPLHLRNAPTQLMKKIGYGKDYKYSHDYDCNFETQEYLPNSISNTVFYQPGNNDKENSIRKHLKSKWKEKYNY